MRALVQRVTEASVSVDGKTIGQIGCGLVVLVCAMQGDDVTAARRMAGRVARLRIFRDETGRMNRPVLDCGKAALVVSQFTLAADMRSGNRPGFAAAAPPKLAENLYEAFMDELRALGLSVACGRFGADMKVALTNDGPVTIWLDGADRDATKTASKGVAAAG
ncbi:MAG: D-aminoacyl-tRNA deacylase [Paracoccus sp. (in: a-proteobacteria)]|nr:D-aminoacyl-tRNA deacylase [Paracoccus sp. (in: a-proteobacteria)]